MKTKAVIENGFKETEIGLIPEDWEVVNVDKYIQFERGTEPGSENYNKDKKGVRFLRVVDISGSRDDKTYTTSKKLKLCKKKDILITFDGSPGIVKQGLEGAYSSGIRKVVIINKDLFSDYVYYVLQTIYVQRTIEKYTTGVTIKHSSKAILHIKIPFFSIQEQQKIAFVLSKVQQSIEQQDKIIQITKGLKKSLLNKLFTEGLHSEEQKKTEIGMMPKSWGVTSIGEIAPFQGGFAFKSQEYHKTGVRLFKIANVSFGKVIWEDISFLPEEYLTEYDEYILSESDIVMAMTRPIVSGGIKVTKLSKADCPCLLNQRVGRFQPATMINPDFLYQFLFTENFVNHILYGAGGSQQPNISANKIEECLIPLPTLPEQKEIADILSNIDKKIQQAESRKQTLQTLFKTMLNQLMTGKVRVKDLDFEVN